MLEFGEKLFDWIDTFINSYYNWFVYLTIVQIFLVWAFFMVEYAIFPGKEMVPFVGASSALLVAGLVFVSQMKK